MRKLATVADDDDASSRAHKHYSRLQDLVLEARQTLVATEHCFGNCSED